MSVWLNGTLQLAVSSRCWSKLLFPTCSGWGAALTSRSLFCKDTHTHTHSALWLEWKNETFALSESTVHSQHEGSVKSKSFSRRGMHVWNVRLGSFAGMCCTYTTMEMVQRDKAWLSFLLNILYNNVHQWKSWIFSSGSRLLLVTGRTPEVGEFMWSHSTSHMVSCLIHWPWDIPQKALKDHKKVPPDLYLIFWTINPLASPQSADQWTETVLRLESLFFHERSLVTI